jgi:hypothetical protein
MWWIQFIIRCWENANTNISMKTISTRDFNMHNNFYIFILYCHIIVVLGYITTFTKEHTIYLQFTTLHHSPFHPPTILRIVSTFSHFYTWTQNIATILPSFTLSYILPPSTNTNSPDRTCFSFLVNVFEKDTFLFKLHREFHYDVSMYVCIIAQIGSSSPFFSFLP